jgi:hypothetical protein
MLNKSSTSSDDAALDFTCPVCKVEPGQWCVYVGRRVRAGYETARLHVQRMQQLWINRADPAAVTTRPHPALGALQAYDRREERLLRAWLRQYVHLLLNVDSPPL